MMDPKELPGPVLARAYLDKQAQVAAEVERARALPVGEQKAAIPAIRALVEELRPLQTELKSRPAIIAVEDGLPSRVPVAGKEPPRPPQRDGWDSILPVLPSSLDRLTRATLQDLFNEHTEALRRLRSGDVGEGLTPEQRTVEIDIGKYDVQLLRDWLTGNGPARMAAEKGWLARKLDGLAVRAGVARTTATGAAVPLTEEEIEMLDRVRRRAARGPESQALSIGAAVLHWLTGESFGWITGSPEELPILDSRDLSAFVVAAGLLASRGEGGSIELVHKSPLRGTRVELQGFIASCERLAEVGLLKVERRLPNVTVSWGPRAISIAEAAGVTVE